MAGQPAIGIPPYIQSNSSGDTFSNNTYDPETGTEMQAINRKQQIANLLVQQSLAPRQGQMVGNVYVPAGWGQGLAQLGQAVAGAYMTKRHDKARSELESQNQQNVANAMQAYQESQQGRPALTVPEGSQGPERPEMPATPESQRMGLVRLMTNQNPQVQRFAQYEAQRQAREAEAKAAREAEANKPQHVDLGDRIGIIRNGQLVGSMPKGLAPQAPHKPMALSPGQTLVDPNTGQATASVPEKTPSPVAISHGQDLIDPRTGQVIASKGDKPLAPMALSPGQSLVDPNTGLSTASVPDRPQAPTVLSHGQMAINPATGQPIASVGDKPLAPMALSPGQSLVDPNTGQVSQHIPDKPLSPVALSPGQSLIDPQTGQPMASLPRAPMALSPGQTLIDPSTGQSTASVPPTAPHPVALSPGQTLVDPTTGQSKASVPAAEKPPIAVSPGQTLVNPQGARVLYQAPSVKEPDPITRTETIQGKNGPQVVGITQSGKVKPIGAAAPKPHDGDNKPPSGYRQTADGNLEAIPGGPADVKAHAAQSKLDAGRQTVNDLVMGLRDHYDQLDKQGGITNPDKGAMTNLTAGIGSSGPGQAVGRLFGTQTQSIRNTIAQQRPLLLNAIKEATGMSAKQMDSNAEMKMYLAAATDPTLDVKANRAALDMLDKLYGLSGQTSAQPAQATAPQGPAVGTVKGGYRFKGGDPASPSSWEKQ